MICNAEMALDKWTSDPYKLSGMTRIPIETLYFSGFMYILIKGIENSPESFFKKYKRCFQYIVQGRFKHNIPFSNLYTGQAWSNPLAMVPPYWLQLLLMPLIKHIQHGLQMLLSGNKPYMLSPMISTMQTIHMNLPGSEPNLPDDIELLKTDDLHAMGITMTTSERKNYFSKTQNHEQYIFDSNYIYTFNFYQHLLHIDSFTIFYFDIIQIIGVNPIQIMLLHVDPEAFAIVSTNPWDFVYNIEIRPQNIQK